MKYLVVTLQCIRMGVSEWYLAGVNINHIHVSPKRPRIYFTFGEENWAHLLSDMCSCSFLVCCLLHVSRLTGKNCAGDILKKERSEGSCAGGVSLLLLPRFSLLFEAYVLWFGRSTKVECRWSIWVHVVVLNPWWTDSEPVDNHQLISLLADFAWITRAYASVPGHTWCTCAEGLSVYVRVQAKELTVVLDFRVDIYTDYLMSP